MEEEDKIKKRLERAATRTSQKVKNSQRREFLIPVLFYHNP